MEANYNTVVVFAIHWHESALNLFFLQKLKTNDKHRKTNQDIV